jgi:hypothetical protein
MITILEKFDAKEMLKAYYSIEPNIQWSEFGHKGKQAGLQYKTNEDPWTSAVGRSTGQELECNNLNPFFKDTIFEEVINKFKLKRTRFMWVGSYACYSMHEDETPRVHFPLITNLQCYFIFKNGIRGSFLNLEINNVYWTDTTQTHSFINCSDVPRLHLVGAVENKTL